MNDELIKIVEGMQAENKDLTDNGKPPKFKLSDFDSVVKTWTENNPVKEVPTQTGVAVTGENTASTGADDSSVTPGVQPSQVVSQGGYEYKFEVSENDKPIYYTKKKDSESWLKVDPKLSEDNFITNPSYISIGQELGHFKDEDFDRDAYFKQQEEEKKPMTEYEIREEVISALPGKYKLAGYLNMGANIIKDLITKPEEREQTLEVAKNAVKNVKPRLFKTALQIQAGAVDLATQDLNYDPKELEYLKTLDPTARYEDPMGDPTGFKTNADKIKYLEGYKNTPIAKRRDEAEVFIKEKFKEIQNVQKYLIKDTGEGMVKGIKQGDASDLIGGIINANTSMVETVVPAMLTGGVSLPFQVIAPMYSDYNEAKAKSIYGKDDPEAMNKLIDNGQTELAIPATLGLFATGLEYVGFKGITKYMFSNPGAKSFGAKLLLTGNKEGLTEWGQGGIEAANIAFGEGKDGSEAGKSLINGMFSEAGVENYLNGFVGASGTSTAGNIINRALRSDNASIKDVNSKINNLADLNYKKNKTKNKEVKEALNVEIKEAEQDLKKYINKKRKLNKVLTAEEKTSLIDILNKKDGIKLKVESLKSQLESGDITNKEFGYAVRSLNNQDKKLSNQLSEIQTAATNRAADQEIKTIKEAIKKSGLDGNVTEMTSEEISESVLAREAELRAEIEANQEFLGTEQDAVAKKNIKDFGTELNNLKQVGSQFGFITQQKDGSFEITINKDKPNSGVAAHEFLHAVLFKTIGNNTEIQTNLGDALVEHAQGLGGDTSVLGKRLSAYGKYNKEGEFIRDDNFGEETITIMSESIVNGSLKFDENFFTKVGDVIRRFSQNYLGKEITFDTGRDVYNFVKDYSKNVKDGKINKAILKVAKEGAKGKLVKGKVEAKEGMQASKEASDKVQSIYEEQGEAGAFEIIEQFKPIVSRITEKRREAPNYDRELLMSEIEIGERGILDLISKYDPDSGVPLAAYINKFLPSRAIEASKRVLGEEFTEDVSERVDIAAEEVEVKVTAKPKKKKTILSDRLGVKNKVDKAIKEKLPELDIENLNFKTLKDQTPEITGEMFGISPKKLISGANITKKELQSAQMFISKNSDVLLAMLPEGATTGGTATGVPNTLLKPFYTKTGRAKMEKTGTKAGLAVQVKNDNISKSDFLEVFGIVDGVPNRTDRNTSARVLALANQTGKMMTNQAVREQLLKQGKPLQSMGHLADGKSTIMFSKKEQVNQKSVQLLGNMDRSLSPEGRTLFWDDISAFANENILDRNLESVKIGLRNVYGSVPEINKNIDKLAEAIHGAIKNVKDPIVKNPIKLVDKLLEINNRQLSKVKEYFNSDTTAVDAFKDPQRVKNLVATTSVLSNRLFDPKNPGKSIAKILMMKGHLASSSKNTYLERKQPLPSNVEFLKATLGSIPGIQFKTNKSKDGKTLLDKSSITYNGKPVSLESVTSAQSSQSALNDTKNETKLKQRGKTEDVAQELLNEITDFYTELYNNGEIDNVDLQMVSASLLSNMDAVLARAAKLKYISDNAYDFKNPGKEVKYEHMQPRVAVLLSMWDAKINGGGITDIKDFLKNYTIQVIPNTMDKVITESNLGESLYVGQTLAMPSWIRTYNDATKDNDKGRLRPLVDVYTKEVLKPSEAIVKGLRILKPQLKENKILNKAIAKGRTMASKPVRGITVLDFDDTLATSKSSVLFTAPDGTTGKLTAEEFAKQGADLLAQGYVYDFSEFNKVVKGKKAPLFEKALKLQSKFGPENMFILTARPAESAASIFEFVKANGLNIPLKNITGLANSTPESKALWMVDKVSEGYNDFYFADDALQNVQAVDNILEQFDVKRKVQQARIKFSKSMNDGFNDILENVTGIESQKRFSIIKGRKRGESKGKFRFFIPPSHEDFVGLLYNFMGKGKEGNAHRDFFEQALVRPLNRAYKEIDTAKQAIANDYKSLNKQFPNVKDKLIKNTPDGDFTFQDAIRVYLWNKHGYTIPGLSKADQTKLVELVEQDAELKAYAETLNVISKQEAYVDPGQSWEAGNIRIDLIDATGRVGRKEYFSEFNENAEVMFSPENLNKIEAAYGKDFREALEDMLHRIKTGVNRPKGASAKPNMFMNWLNASVSGVMFFNTRSSLLQQMSNVNFLNFADNNVFKAGLAFANQPQYWKDFAMIFNSDMMKQRRGGLGTDINGAELAEAIKKARPDNIFDQVAIITGKALKLGFLPTQIGDNIAIATGGAAFYRNRVNKNIKDGMSIKKAEAAAFTDLQNITQSTQQSARPDMTSQQQASWIGKLVLNFLNTPSQYNRIIKKAGSDIINRRITPPNTTQTQSDMSNSSRILYYGAAQNLIFYSLQTALFAVMFGTDDEDDDKRAEQFLKKKERVINGTIDTLLRGSGIYGVAVSTLKNMIIKFIEQRDPKKYNKDESAVLMELANFSPVVGIKFRRIVNAEKTLNYNVGVMNEMETFDVDNPSWSAATNYIQTLTTAPVNKIYQKSINLRNAADNQYTAFQRALFFSGYTTWSLNLGDTEKMKQIKQDVKDKAKAASKEKAALKKEEKKQAEEKVIIDQVKEEKKQEKEGKLKDPKCSGVKSDGSRCGISVEKAGDKCTIHETAEQNKTGKKSQCKKIKKDGKRCSMQTSSKSGFCYYHD